MRGYFFRHTKHFVRKKKKKKRKKKALLVIFGQNRIRGWRVVSPLSLSLKFHPSQTSLSASRRYTIGDAVTRTAWYTRVNYENIIVPDERLRNNKEKESDSPYNSATRGGRWWGVSVTEPGLRGKFGYTLRFTYTVDRSGRYE